MPKLTDTQTIVLSAGAQRPDNIAMPLPKGLHGAAAKKSVAAMIARGWLEEVEADLRRGDPLWRETGDGNGTTLIVTEAGLGAIEIEPVVAKTTSGPRKAKPDPEDVPASSPCSRAPVPVPVPVPVKIRSGTKQAQIIALLQRPEGASIAEIVEVTGWQAHSARGVISGALKKKLGLPVTSEKVDGRGTVYHLDRAG